MYAATNIHPDHTALMAFPLNPQRPLYSALTVDLSVDCGYLEFYVLIDDNMFFRLAINGFSTCQSSSIWVERDKTSMKCSNTFSLGRCLPL